MEVAERLEGREDVDIVNLDEEPDRAKEILRDIRRQGKIDFETVPQCVLKDRKGEYHLCDTENMEQVLNEMDE